MRSLVLSASLALGLGVSAPATDAQQGQGPPTVGLALSGGSAKGFAHIGVLRTLERLGVQVDVVAGTSMGAVVGGLYSIGLSVDSIERIVTDADWSSLIGDGIPRRRFFLDQRRLDERTILNVPLRDRRIAIPSGAIVGSNVMRLLEHVTWQAAMVRRFDSLPRPFVAVATDLETGDPLPLTGGVLAEAIRASTGVPGAVEPYLLEGHLLVDGALSRNLPASDARALGANVVICSDVSEPLDSAEELQSVVDVLTQLASLSMLTSTLEQRELCDVLILPSVDGMSGLDFAQVEEWIRRGTEAADAEAADLGRIAADRRSEGRPGALPDASAALLGDSVRITAIEIAGSDDPRVLGLVRRELDLARGVYVDRSEMESHLEDLDATGLFALVRYRLDDDGTGGAELTVVVEQRPRDRLGVGLRYDDERQAALLFTASVHSFLRYGSLTRLELRVGEETRIGVSYRRRRGVTGRLGSGFSLGWSQGPLALDSAGGRVDVDVLRSSVSVGLGVGRAAYLGVELGGERATYGGDDATFVSAAVLLDHETLDRIDFPTSGLDLSGRLEWGDADVTVPGWFSTWSIDAGTFVPLHVRVTADLGVFAGYARGSDLPVHRRFFVGGSHRSAVFRATHPTFLGLESQGRSGAAVQIARAGLRVEVRRGIYLRAGVDIGGVRDEWTFPMDRPLTGWGLQASTGTLVGPVTLEISQLWADRDPRVSVSVGRQF